MSCFKCHRAGHFARECTSFSSSYTISPYAFDDIGANENRSRNRNHLIYNNDTTSGIQRCYRCNEFGHIARECSADNDIRTCYNCGQNGHIRNECSLSINPMTNMNSNLRNSGQCYRCGQSGHFSRECSMLFESNGISVPNISKDAIIDRLCFNCRRPGHIAAACPQTSRTDTHDVLCYRCNHSGHISRNCPDSDMKCYSCGLIGHMARDCSNNRIFSSSAAS